ncbi:MAG: ABC transporter substrate-binding protein [Actinomycetota bacterium]|jgi:ABC-type branched-subunit amino acid transport system substrate-binding protein|nr:ABC transporter substrate-binding protein [Actinomycetota bacterium]
MTSRLRLTRGAAALGVAALALSACGGGNGGTTAPAATGSSPAEQSGGEAPQGDGTLTIGSLLPQTGNLAFLGPPEFAGVELAIKEINEAGGVLGKPIAYEEGDSGDAQQDVANPTVDRLLRANVDAIIGAASSGVSKTVIDKITGAGVVQFSPANTSPDFTDYPDDGLYFRTAPSDVLQGRILGETILADGHTSVGLLVLQDPYGEGLAKNLGDTITENGGELAPEGPVFYDPAASNFDAQVGQIKAANPDAIVLIGFEESAKVIQSMIAQGIGPQDKQLYLVDGNLSNTLGDELPPGVLEGTKGSLPGAAAPGDFQQRLRTIDPGLTDFAYSAEAYDAVVTIGLAAAAAGNDSGQAIAAELPDVTREGTKCTTFAQCSELLGNGEDIDYEGVSGPIELSEAGDPTEASVGIYTYGPDNKYGNPVYASGSLE